MNTKARRTPWGAAVDFEDDFGHTCSVQESMAGSTPHLRIGRLSTQNSPAKTMCLSREQVKELLPYLQRFAETGKIL